LRTHYHNWQAGFDSRLGHTEDMKNDTSACPASCLGLMVGAREWFTYSATNDLPPV